MCSTKQGHLLALFPLRTVKRKACNRTLIRRLKLFHPKLTHHYMGVINIEPNLEECIDPFQLAPWICHWSCPLVQLGKVWNPGGRSLKQYQCHFCNKQVIATQPLHAPVVVPRCNLLYLPLEGTRTRWLNLTNIGRICWRQTVAITHLHPPSACPPCCGIEECASSLQGGSNRRQIWRLQ